MGSLYTLFNKKEKINGSDYHQIEEGMRQSNQKVLCLATTMECLCVFFMFLVKTWSHAPMGYRIFLLGMFIFATLICILSWALTPFLKWIVNSLVYVFLVFSFVFALMNDIIFCNLTLFPTFIPILFILSGLFVEVKNYFRIIPTISLILYLVFSASFHCHDWVYLLMTACVGGVSNYLSNFHNKNHIKQLFYDYKLMDQEVNDQLTGVRNRKSFDKMLDQYPKLAERSLACIYIEVDGLQEVNMSDGDDSGDYMLKFVSFGLKQNFGERDVYRISGSIFVVFALDTGIDQINNKVERLREVYKKKGYKVFWGIEIVSIVKYREDKENSFDISMPELIQNAKSRKSSDKERYFRENGVSRRAEDEAITLLKNEYLKIMKVDILYDKYQVIKMPEQEVSNENGYSDKFSTYVQSFVESGNIHPDDIVEFLRKTDIEYIQDYFSRGNGTLEIRYHRCVEDEYLFSIIEMFPSSSKGEENRYYYLFVRILEKTNSMLYEMKKNMLNASRMEYSLSGNLMERKDADVEDETEEHPEKKDRLARAKKLLIIDDSDFNQKTLRDMLADEYKIMIANNGREALEILQEQKKEIDLIFLDTQMPVMDGREFLEYKKYELQISEIPVIVTADHGDIAKEEQYLSLGATDFIVRPHNSSVLRYRIRSIISLRESANTLSLIERDEMTGTYTRQAFFYHAQSILRKYPEEQLALVMTDVKDFKRINAFYGEKIADKVLKDIAFYFISKKSSGVEVIGRIGPDQFAALIDMQEINAEEFYNELVEYLKVKNFINNLIIKCGIYEKLPYRLPMQTVCDRALLAIRDIKNSYSQHISKYNSVYEEELTRHRWIETEMENALETQQFQVYYQPKHDTDTGLLIGAEALVRWNHPKYGFVLPNHFIPVFEENGFVAKVDYYVWKKVCENQNRWLDLGYPVVPVSVNASMVDFMEPDFWELLHNPIREHSLPPEYVHIEVTETLIAQSMDELIALFKKLQKEGFQIEMDDFGSGYSSLTALATLPLDVVKMDMQFMKQISDPRKRRIVASVITLAKSLNMKVTAEGVETKEQVELLKEMKCNYIQGYYYSKPIPEEEFEQYMQVYGKTSIKIEELEDERYDG